MNRDRRAVFAALAAFCLGLYGLAGLSASPARAETGGLQARLEALKIGQMRKLEVLETPAPAPEVSLVGPDGAAISLDAFRGKAVFLNVWAVWCAPCKREMPSIDRLAGLMQASPDADKVAVVALSIDRKAETGKNYLSGQGLEQVSYYFDPDQETAMSLGVAGLPTTVLLDREGRVVARFAGGAEWDSAEAVAVMEALIKG